jgi:ectoine hydroxylase-related dioxygenase (phytanoyl-CoA dioxygenase family)
MLLVFPGEVFHFTSQNDTEIERVSISGNFYRKGT